MSIDAAQLLPPPSRYAVGSSPWWIEKLTRALARRQARYRELERYYRGEQDLQMLTDEAWVESGMAIKFPDGLNANYARLVVNAAAQRLVVVGFRLAGDFRADVEASRIWRANQMDALADVAITESLVKGECPVMVEPNPRDPLTPIITPQDPAECIVWTASGDRRIRRAALKTWFDEDVRRRVYVLMLPDRIERWQDKSVGRIEGMVLSILGQGPAEWERVDWRRNPIGEVPVVVIPNEPRLRGQPEAEHESVLTQIDLYNKTLMEMAVTSQELAWPQRYGTGVEDSAEDEDEEETATGTPRSGRPTTGKTRWITVPAPDAQFGQFAAASLENHARALDLIRAGIATVSFTPYHFLLNMPTSVPPSGEAITASDAAPTDKAKAHQRDKGAAFREVQRIVFRTAGDERRAAAMAGGEVVWIDPERRTEAGHMDALGKMRTMLGAPRGAMWERIPLSPAEIARWEAMDADERARGIVPPTTGGTPPATPGSTVPGTEPGDAEDPDEEDV